jgi:hypothetical protein
MRGKTVHRDRDQDNQVVATAILDPTGPPSEDRPPPDEGPAEGRGWFPVTRFAAMAAVLHLTAWASVRFLPLDVNYFRFRPSGFPGDFVFDGWMHMDGGWYSSIAQQGYTYRPNEMSSVAFFPAYPLAMRLVQTIVHDDTYILPGILVTFVCGLVGAVLLFRWFARMVAGAPAAARAGADPAAVARSALLVLLVYPYSWYLYGVVYADALFLLCAVASFLLAERDRPVLAGIVGIIATAARPVGFGVVIGLVAVVAERRRIVTIGFVDDVRASRWRTAWRSVRSGSRSRAAALAAAAATVHLHPRRLRRRDAGVLLALGGLALWMWFLRTAFGDPLLFAKAQSAPGWDQQPGLHTWFKVPWLGNLARFPRFLVDPHGYWDAGVYTAGITLQALLVFGAIALVPLVVRRIGWGYAVYVIGVIGVPILGSKDWQGAGRYLLAAFPVFLVAGWWLADQPSRRLRAAVLGVSFATLVLLTSSFARGFYLA